jgi:putative hydrolase of the HAD superfamily
MGCRIKAVGFDLGDTLIYYRDVPMSWVALYRKALQSVAASCQTSPTDAQFAAAEQILTRHNTRVTPRTHEVRAEDIFSTILRSWEIDPTEHLCAAMDAYFTFFQQQMCAYPETIEVMTSLRKRGMPSGILTDVPYGMPREFVERDINGAGINGLFDVLVTSVEVGVRKPEPAGYVALATKLNVLPNEMLYIGNEPKDVIGASHAGMTSVFLDRSNSGANHGQDFTVTTIAGINDILTGARKSNPA